MPTPIRFFSTPAPQWSDSGVNAAPATRLVPVLDASGFWVLRSGEPASATFVADPSGFTITDATLAPSALRTAVLPSGFVVTY